MLSLRRRRRLIVGAALALVLIATLSLTIFTLASSADRTPQNNLTINVGYVGGPYYEKEVFTFNDLNNMVKVQMDYTFLDETPSVVIDHVEGVTLASIITAAGIDVDSVKTFHFFSDGSDSPTSIAKKYLIDTPRYSYPNLADNFANGAALPGADEGAVPVQTLIALRDDWGKVSDGYAYDGDMSNLSGENRYRLIYGQENTGIINTKNATSAQWIHTITVELEGSPSISLNVDGGTSREAGSTFKITANVTHPYSFFSAPSASDIQWKSSDTSVATVDDNGNVTILKAQEVTITATYGGVEESVVINPGASASPSPSPSPSASPSPSPTTTPRRTTSTTTATPTPTSTTTTTTTTTSPTTDATPAPSISSVLDDDDDEYVPWGGTYDDDDDPTPSPTPIEEETDVMFAYEILGTNSLGSVTDEEDEEDLTWSLNEMPESAMELSQLEEGSNPLGAITAVTTALLLIGGIVGRVILYYIDVGGSYVFFGKFK